MKSLNFSSKAAYKRWLAYGHMHTKTGKLVKAKVGRQSLFASTPGYAKISIRGRVHKVKHKR